MARGGVRRAPPSRGAFSFRKRHVFRPDGILAGGLYNRHPFREIAQQRHPDGRGMGGRCCQERRAKP